MNSKFEINKLVAPVLFVSLFVAACSQINPSPTPIEIEIGGEQFADIPTDSPILTPPPTFTATIVPTETPTLEPSITPSPTNTLEPLQAHILAGRDFLAEEKLQEAFMPQ